MTVAELWRYPVKSMAGERLERVTVGPMGLEGDRVVYVRRFLGRIATARKFPRLLSHRATLGQDGEPLVDGRPWTDPAVAREIEEIVGRDARLVRDDDPGRFDVLPLLVATDGSIEAFGRDGRRLRPNIVIGGVEGLAERGWGGRSLRIGDVEIAIEDLRDRCVMTTYDPDTQVQDASVLRDIVERFDGKLALNARVMRGGLLRVGDPVLLD
ncbi:MAG TPA: MOSC N-terminal beta barrel domain-containing protein [Candidatus Polarisedimenticolaceae bacterium]|nr:MOSC N-terminal beta barrel domain-containing protein [Candidatus Polarisedimenticolaceae bacterium]